MKSDKFLLARVIGKAAVALLMAAALVRLMLI